MVLFINTNSKEEIKFFISDEYGKILFSKINIIDFKDSQKILELLNNFILDFKLDISTIKYLVVCNGLGINMNFRIGIIIANAIAYKLNIPIIGVLSTEFETNEDFIKIGIEKTKNKKYSQIITPEYSVRKTL